MGKSALTFSISRVRSRVCTAVMSCSHRLGEALVSVGVEFVGQFRSAGLDNASADEYVDELRLDVTQNPGVVRDHKNPAVRFLGVAVDSVTDHFQCVDGEAGVGLVEDRDLRLEQSELQDLVTLLFAARKAFVHTAL